MNLTAAGPGNARTFEPGAATPLYATPHALERPLRVLMLLPGRVPGWVATFLQQAATNRWLEVSVLQVADGTLPAVADLPADVRAFLRFERARKPLAWALSLVPVDGAEASMLTPAVSTTLDGRALAARVRDARADLVVSIGPQAWSEAVADVSPWGCWNVDASLVDPLHAATALLAPMLQDASATKVELELEVERTWRAPASLAASWGSTQYSSFSQQRERALLKLPMLLLRALRRLATGKLDVPRHHCALLRLAPPTVPLPRCAGLRAFALVMQRMASWQLEKRRKPMSWMLLLRRDRKRLDPMAPHMGPMAVIQAAPGNFWADPCVIQDAGRKLVFVEEMTPSGKGTIACLELGDKTVTRLGLAVDEPGHLSFPQVMRWNDDWYMTLESSALKRISLYRATGFPLGWARIEDLVCNRVCVDPVLHLHEGLWYLFAVVAENRNSTWDELFLFVSEQITGPFRPHPANPVISDVRRARCAGRLFNHDGKLIRPAQDCASGYGSAVVFNEVLELSPERYSELPISRLAPDWSRSLVACHTYSADGGVELLDARGHRPPGTPVLEVVEGSARCGAGTKSASTHASRQVPSIPSSAIPAPGRGAVQ